MISNLAYYFLKNKHKYKVLVIFVDFSRNEFKSKLNISYRLIIRTAINHTYNRYHQLTKAIGSLFADIIYNRNN